MARLTDIDADFRRELAALIHAHLAELDDLDARGRAAQGVVTLDQQAVGRLSRMDALQSQAMARAQQTRRDTQRSGLLAALDRIDSPDFGHCDDCGDPIAPARLRQNPAVTRCIGCATG